MISEKKLLKISNDALDYYIDLYEKQNIDINFQPKITYSRDLFNDDLETLAIINQGHSSMKPTILFQNFMDKLKFKRKYNLDVSEGVFYEQNEKEVSKISKLPRKDPHEISLFLPLRLEEPKTIRSVIGHELWHLIEEEENVIDDDFLAEGTAIYASEHFEEYEHFYGEFDAKNIQRDICAGFIYFSIKDLPLHILLDKEDRLDLFEMYKDIISSKYKKISFGRNKYATKDVREIYSELDSVGFVKNPSKENLFKHLENTGDYKLVQEIKNQDVRKLVKHFEGVVRDYNKLTKK